MLSIGGAARGSFEFDCVDAEFADSVEGAIDGAFVESVTKPFAIIRIVTTPGRFSTVAGGPGIPGSWFALEIAPASSAESLPTWHSQLQPNGYPAHARGVTSNITYLGFDGPVEPRGPRPQSVGAGVAKQITVPSAIIAACAIGAAPNSAQGIPQVLGSVTEVTSLCVRDVGQASFSSLCDDKGRALLHYDVGFPISFNGRTSPKTFDLDPSHKPPVVLSHWDWDHLHAAFLRPHLMDCVWIVPDQRLGPGAARLARILTNKGKLLIHPATTTSFPIGEVAQASGSKASLNDAGLTLSVTLASGRTVLLTGDVDYAFLSHSSVGSVDVLVATHHGARFAAGGSAIPAPAVGADTLLLSYGKRNVYRHPHVEALRLHKNAGWTKQISTARMAGLPRGDRTVT
ncbi:metallo-hydrolase/oxidoreductase [Mesorhizobium sp. M0510]|uniref:metallo-hydrolase/oxidoreductase n=1 Tax=Mesorhizobium sp. M0510 TaxID=2956954 RepID=UPI00333D9E79